MKNIFTEHPHSVGESYFTHLKFSCSFGIRMIAASFAALLHGIFPFLFKSTGSDILIKTMDKFVDRRSHLEDKLVNPSHAIENKKIKPVAD